MCKFALISGFLFMSYAIPTMANQYVVAGETMECRINGSNGIPGIAFLGGPNERLKMTDFSNGVSIQVDYEPGQSQLAVSYEDKIKQNKLGYVVNFFDTGTAGIIKTAVTSLTLEGIKTEIECNVRPASTGIPIPPPPKI